MKQIFKMLFVAQLAFLVSCGGNAAVKEEENKSESSKTTENTEVSEKDKPEESVSFFVKDMKNGDEICGLKINNFKYVHEQEFSFETEGEVTLSGSLSVDMMDGGIEFTPDAEMQQRATMKFNNIEKPLFLWTTISNIDDLLVLLSDEQKAKITETESLPVKIRVKNYYVAAGGNNIWAGAEFVNMEE